MKNLLSLFILISISSYSQINSKNKWYFGVEIGTNNITSVYDSKQKFQFGLLSEYYFDKNWGITGRIKYFETGVSFEKKATSEGFGSKGFYGSFKGSIISIPLDLKYEFGILKKLKGNIFAGLAYNYEIESNYYFSSNLSTDYTRSFFSLNTGLGFTYFVSNDLAVILNSEWFNLGGYKGNNNGFILSTNYYTNNQLINFGIKYNFKKLRK